MLLARDAIFLRLSGPSQLVVLGVLALMAGVVVWLVRRGR